MLSTRKAVSLILLGILLLSFACQADANEDRNQLPVSGQERAGDLEVFSLKGCPRCAEAEPFIERLRSERPDLRIYAADISSDENARRRLFTLAEAQGVTAVSTPAFYVRGELIIGWVDEQTTGARILSLLPPASFDVERKEKVARAPATDLETVEVPLLGRLSVRRMGLTFFSLVLGLIDGFNPCAMWALLFLLSMLVNLHDRRKMFIIGGVFILVGGALYYAFMAAWLEVFLLVGLSRAVQITLGTIALFVGLVNVKDFFAFKKGVSFTIPESAKPKIYERVRRVLSAQNLIGALVSVALVSALINTVELLCSAGLPAVYTQILTAHQLPHWQYYGYLLIYIAAYILDDSIMLTIAVVTLGRLKLQERAGRWLKLVSGAVMAMLGAGLLLKPDWLM